jgi:PLP dependent protein
MSNSTPDTLDESLCDRLNSIRSQLPVSVRLIAVTKTVPADIIRIAYAAGIRDFGENRRHNLASNRTSTKQ